ncbi:hypothetical protein PYCC9005_001403 [Savitreella phatthalungensis]
MSEHDELKAEVQLLAGLLVEQHVAGWYDALTDDRQLLAQLTELTETLYAQVAERSNSVAWQQFIEEKIPREIVRFLQDFNAASERRLPHQTHEDAFLELCDHSGRQNPECYRADIADGLLVLFLPFEDLSSDVAYSFLRELLADLVLRALIDRLSQPWFIDSLLLRLHSRHMPSWRQSIGFCLSRLWNAKMWAAVPTQSNNRDVKSLYETFIFDIIGTALARCVSPLIHALLISMVFPAIDLVCGNSLVTYIQQTIRTMTERATMTRAARFCRALLFPDGRPMPMAEPPDEEEQASLRSRVEALIGIDMPFWSSAACNAVLLLRIFDLLLAELLPELTRRTPSELRKMRVRVQQADIEAQGLAGIQTRPTTREGVLYSRHSLDLTASAFQERQILSRSRTPPAFHSTVALQPVTTQRLAGVKLVCADDIELLDRGYHSDIPSEAPTRTQTILEDAAVNRTRSMRVQRGIANTARRTQQFIKRQRSPVKSSTPMVRQLTP